MKERTANPIHEYKPVLISKIKKLDIAKRTSAYKSAVPIFTLVYFLKIAAIISVPPLEVPRLKSTAEAKAGDRLSVAASVVVKLPFLSSQFVSIFVILSHVVSSWQQNL